MILAGGRSEQGNAEHRYLVGQFLERFGDQVQLVVTAQAPVSPLYIRLQRMIKRGSYRERLNRAIYGGSLGPAAAEIQTLLLPEEAQPQMPGAEKVFVVPSHNSEACRDLIYNVRPCVIVVYGTPIISSTISNLSRLVTLNMHTGLSPYYRGDSTLFWPVFFNEPDRLGVTVHKLEDSIDAGDIACTAPVIYTAGDSEAHLFAKAVKIGTALYLDTVERALAGTLQCTPQDLSLGREFRWMDRTVAAEREVVARLHQWKSDAKVSA
ncbi:MAG: formyl transferase [Granulosicoccus sp.]